MESDEALSEALLSRKPIRRVALACIACRLRKVKCDSTQPSCIRCRVDGKQCEYQKSRRGGRPRRPAAAPVQAASWPDPAQAPTINGPVVHAPPSLSVAGSTSARSGSSGSSRSPFRTSPPSSTGNSDALLDLGSLFGFGSVAWLREATSGITGNQADRLLTQYYVYFHASHPCVLPKVALHARLVNEPGFACTLLPVLLYIGSIFTDSAPSDLLSEIALKAVNEVRSQGSHFTPVFVQTLTLYSIAVYWCNEPQRGRNILDEAIQVAVDIGMHRAQFAKQHGCDDPVLEESWRRTWWQLYITDAHIAGSTHTFPTKTGALHITTELPCEEELYDCGQIPPSPNLRSYDVREFSSMEFSSFAHLIGFTQGVNRVLATGRSGDLDQAKTICSNADTTMSAWCSLLPASKRRILRDDGTVDELLFKANILRYTYIVDLHREISSLHYCPIESVSQCAPPAPPSSASSMMVIREDAHVHTAKCLYAIDKLSSLLTLPTRFATHTPFIICMIANMTIAHLSACAHLFREPRLSEEREKIRLNMGVLKMLGEYWPAGSREYGSMGVIAREILSLKDEDIRVPETLSILPSATLDLDLDLDFDLDFYSNSYFNLGMDMNMPHI